MGCSNITYLHQHNTSDLSRITRLTQNPLLKNLIVPHSPETGDRFYPRPVARVRRTQKKFFSKNLFRFFSKERNDLV